jgi:transposase, IS5 family
MREAGGDPMIRDRYDPVDLFTQIPKRCLQFEPVLAHLDRLLEDDELFRAVKADLARRSPRSLTRGRRSTPVEVILRMLVVRRLYGFSYEQTEHFVADSLILRQFCRLYLEPAPDDTTLIRWAHQIQPATLEKLNERVVALARQAKVTRGRKLRVDGTVVETNIHHPTDASLLADGVRGISRQLRRGKGLVGSDAALPAGACRDRTRSVRSLLRAIHRLARRRREATRQVERAAVQPEVSTERQATERARKASERARKAGESARKAGERARAAMKACYQRLLKVAQQSQRQAERVAAALRRQGSEAAQRLAAQLEQWRSPLEQVVRQTRRRVLLGEKVPAAEKCVSVFEPHTQILKQGKPGRDVEFGRKVWLAEVEGGIVSGYRVLAAGAEERDQLAGTLAQHQQQFGRAPALLTADRGISSPENEAIAQAAGVKRVVLPARGKVPPERIEQERQRWFRRGYRFRAGIEGRISSLHRRYGFDRCREQGEAGLGRWAGWAILTSNLVQIAQAQAARQAA